MPKARIKRLYLIPILSKAFDVLELLEQNNAPATLEEIYRKTRISKTSVYRILKTMVHRGYVNQAQNGEYRLVSRPRRLRFGFAVQSADMPFSIAVTESLRNAAASAGVELIVLDNRQDPVAALRNAEEFVAKHVDLVLEFQVEEQAAPRIAQIFKKAGIPLVAIDVPHPNATYFGVDNFDTGYQAGTLLGQHAQHKWKGKADWVVGLGFPEAGSFVQGRIDGAFDAIRERIHDIPDDHFVEFNGRGMREPSRAAIAAFLSGTRKGERVLVATANDSSALGVLEAARQAKRESDFAIVGQDCIEEVLAEMQRSRSAIIGSISHEVESYGPRLIQLGIALLRGYAVPPYNYVRHRAVTPETLAETAPSPEKSISAD